MPILRHLLFPRIGPRLVTCISLMLPRLMPRRHQRVPKGSEVHSSSWPIFILCRALDVYSLSIKGLVENSIIHLNAVLALQGGETTPYDNSGVTITASQSTGPKPLARTTGKALGEFQTSFSMRKRSCLTPQGLCHTCSQVSHTCS